MKARRGAGGEAARGEILGDLPSRASHSRSRVPRGGISREAKKATDRNGDNGTPSVATITGSAPIAPRRNGRAVVGGLSRCAYGSSPVRTGKRLLGLGIEHAWLENIVTQSASTWNAPANGARRGALVSWMLPIVGVRAAQRERRGESARKEGKQERRAERRGPAESQRRESKARSRSLECDRATYRAIDRHSPYSG